MKNKTAKFEELVNVFNTGTIQSHYQFILHLDKKGIKVIEFMVFARKLFRERAKFIKTLNRTLDKMKLKVSCPECGEELGLLSITIPQGKNNVNGWRSVLSCTECTYENYSVLQVGKRRTKINRSRRVI